MAPARRTRPSLTKPKQEPVAQRRGTKLAPVTKNAEEATMTVEEEQAAQESSVSNMGVSRSRKRKGLDDEEQAAQNPPASNTGVSHSRKRRGVDEEPLAFQEQRPLGTALAQKSQEPPASNMRVSHSRKRRRVDEEPLAFQEQ